MKLPKATSEVEKLTANTACYQACSVRACNRSDTGCYMERKLHWKSQCMLLAEALSVHVVIHLLTRQQNKEMIHSAFTICEFCKISDFHIMFISSWRHLTYLDYLSSESIFQPAGHHFPTAFLHKESGSLIHGRRLNRCGRSSNQSSHRWKLQTVNLALKLKVFSNLWFPNLLLVMNLKREKVFHSKYWSTKSTKKKYSSCSCTNSKAGLFHRSLSRCYSNTRARFCNPLFKHQSQGVKAGQRKTCAIRSCDLVKKKNTFHEQNLVFKHIPQGEQLFQPFCI